MKCTWIEQIQSWIQIRVLLGLLSFSACGFPICRLHHTATYWYNCWKLHPTLTYSYTLCWIYVLFQFVLHVWTSRTRTFFFLGTARCRPLLVRHISLRGVLIDSASSTTSVLPVSMSRFRRHPCFVHMNSCLSSLVIQWDGIQRASNIHRAGTCEERNWSCFVCAYLLLFPHTVLISVTFSGTSDVRTHVFDSFYGSIDCTLSWNRMFSSQFAPFFLSCQ